MNKIIDTYKVTADYVPATIRILEKVEENVPIYEISMPEFDVGTTALIGKIMEDLARIIPVSTEETTDPKKMEELRLKFFDAAKKEISKKFPRMKEEGNVLAGVLLHNMYGLGDVELLLSDPLLEEIVINNSLTPLAVYHKKYGWLKTTKTVNTEEEIYNIASQIGRKAGRQISLLNPIMDARLITGDRVAATLFPISTQGNTITIRKFSRSPWNVITLLKNKAISKEMLAFLWLAIQYELNVMVAGATASGKTSLLNALVALMPPTQRIISIEDTREITLPESLHWNWIPMNSRTANPEGQGAISMLDLMIASLRMRPDRIVVGEVRRKEQVETMFEAMHTGHSVYTTIHAETVQQVLRRLLEPPIQIPKTELESLQLILIQYRDRRKNIRRSLELAELLSGGKEEMEVNYLYRWRPRTDTFEKINQSIRVFEDLNLHTGMTQQEILKDLKQKEMILQWLLDYSIEDIDILGKVFKTYYKNPELIINAAVKKQKPESVVK